MDGGSVGTAFRRPESTESNTFRLGVNFWEKSTVIGLLAYQTGDVEGCGGRESANQDSL